MQSKRSKANRKVASKRSPVRKGGGGGLVHLDKSRNNAQLYNGPLLNNNSYRPRLYQLIDAFDTISAERSEMSRFGRGLFTTEPVLGGSIIQKNTFCFGENWMPSYHGTNKAWGAKAEKWLVENWMPYCNVLGGNYDFLTTLYLSGVAMDVDGDTLLIPVVLRNGFPMVQLVPSHRIGNRHAQQTIDYGRFSGSRVVDGVVLNDRNRSVGYQLIADTEDQDTIIPVNNCNFLFNPEFSQQHRGISRIARSVLNWLDTQDIDTYEKAAVKLASSVGLIHKTESGSPDQSAIIGANETTTTADATLSTEQVDAATVYYLKANSGEEVQSFMSDRPSPNVDNFVRRLHRESIYSMGWFIELMNPENLGGGGARFISEMANMTIRNQQRIVEKRANYMIRYALSTAMENGMLPQNYNDEWYNWTYTKPANIVIDRLGETSTDLDSIRMGTTTLETVVAKSGRDWVDIRTQQQKEMVDLLDRATELSDQYDITIEAALNLLQQRNPNPKIAEDTTNDTQQTQ